MIPLLLISDDSKKIKNYLKTILDKNGYFFQVRPEGKEYCIGEIKNLKKETNIFNKNVRLYCLENFHASSLEAQNSILKILEEPPRNVLFVLTTDNEQKLIPTIRSRTKIVYLDKKKSLPLGSQAKEALTKLIKDNNLKLLSSDQITLEDVIAFFRERLMTDKKSPLILKEAVKL